ncbi:hypothetical protein [Microbaculum sp. FT89]|uniref:hypothetical protein n=1 Tax=Microbaculum sp. FT89 TaxID=3447298 RepID=UPI003F539B67
MLRRLAILIGLAVSLAACEETTGDYVTVTGGGFLFNYRLAEATYGLVATARRTVPPGTVFIADFENPEGGPPLTVELVSREKQRRFALNSPPIKNVVADTPYTVTLTLKTPEGAVIETHETTYTSKIGSSVLPEKPLTIGPGYTKNPDLKE